MSPALLKTTIHNKTSQNADTFVDSKLVEYVNAGIDYIAGKVQQQRPEVWNIPAEFDLVANQREYSFPSDVINKLTSLDVKINGKFVRAIGLKKAPSIPLTEEAIRENFKEPHYFIRRNAIFLLTPDPIPAVSQGGVLTYNSFPALLTTDRLSETEDLSEDPSLTEHGFPREFHELLATYVSLNYKSDNEQSLSETDRRFDLDMQAKLAEFSAPADESIEEIRDLRTDYYNNGFNL